LATIVDHASRLSRATLTREIAALMRRYGSNFGEQPARVTNQPRSASP
jgi:hypothetical protein